MSGSSGPIQDLTPIELMFMRIIWDGKTTTRDIYDSLPATNRKRLAFSTVSTYLARLVQKGYLKREPTAGREFEYNALVPKEDVQDRVIQKIFENEAELMDRFAGNSTLTHVEQEQLKAIAARLKKKP